MRNKGRIGTKFIEEDTYGADDVEVRFFAAPAHIIHFAGLPFFENEMEGLAVVVHVEPVAHVQSVTIDGKGFAFESIHDHKRDQFFRKLPRPVVI